VHSGSTGSAPTPKSATRLAPPPDNEPRGGQPVSGACVALRTETTEFGGSRR
jgi:hypothetical protein